MTSPQVEVLVLDEADTMCDMGFLPDVKRVLQRVPARRQTLFFLRHHARGNPAVVSEYPQYSRDRADQCQRADSHCLPTPCFQCRRDSSETLLLALLQQTATGRVIIFTRTKHRARSLARELEHHDFRVTQLQGNLSQNRRQAAMDGFREGKYDLLVATDIAAHGIDVSQVSHVINFDIPDTVDAYTHRIGRTGRALHSGEAFTLATPDDDSVVRAVERTLKTRIPRRALAGFDYGDFSPEAQFPQQTPKQPRPAQFQPNAGRPGSPAPRRSSPRRPANRPPSAPNRQPGQAGNAPQRSGPSRRAN